jgi:hypothetical protein
MQSKAKIIILGGGFANGKTSVACVKAINLSRDYPGSNGLIARSTYPKLNDTVRKEFLKWLPKDWIKSFPMSANSSNTCTLTNGTMVNFRYIAQQGKSTGEATTSNQLSATYDWIIVDQMEDPEIVEKDLLDLIGRLRGSTPYVGDDPTMPITGPRQLIITTNPTRNWLYRKVVKPMFDFRAGIYNEDLMCETDANGVRTIGPDGKHVPLIEMFEGSTYENRDNLPDDYLMMLESSYRGQMKDRYLLGKWEAYEGLIYPHFGYDSHVIDHNSMMTYFRDCKALSKQFTFVEAYDYGMASPYCYLCGFADHFGNVMLLDGLYKKEVTVNDQILAIKGIRDTYRVPDDQVVLADPDVFRRKSGDGKTVGTAISDIFSDGGIWLTRGNNDIRAGITKVHQYLVPQKFHRNPITGVLNAPYLYVSSKLQFVHDEFGEYRWAKNSFGDNEDKPVDKNDHAMDAIKYMLSHRPEVSTIRLLQDTKTVGLNRWAEINRRTDPRAARHGKRSAA